MRAKIKDKQSAPLIKLKYNAKKLLKKDKKNLISGFKNGNQKEVFKVSRIKLPKILSINIISNK